MQTLESQESFLDAYHSTDLLGILAKENSNYPKEKGIAFAEQYVPTLAYIYTKNNSCPWSYSMCHFTY